MMAGVIAMAAWRRDEETCCGVAVFGGLANGSGNVGGMACDLMVTLWHGSNKHDNMASAKSKYGKIWRRII